VVGYVQQSPSTLISFKQLQKSRLVDWQPLVELLRPRHSFFFDKQGLIESFQRYSQEEDEPPFFYYPKCKYQNRLNPHRKRKLNRSHVARSLKQVLAWKEAYHLDNLKFGDHVLTFPKEISEWLGRQPHGREIAWRCFQRWWADCLLKLDDRSSGQACVAYLHIWSSDKPLEPHWHFHLLSPNCREVEVSAGAEDGEAFGFEERPYHRQRGGGLVPFSDDQADVLKEGWFRIVLNMAHRHGMDNAPWVELGKLDVRFGYISLLDDAGKRKLMHKLKYCGRSPIEDYARYSNKHLDCADCPEQLQRYANKARPYGFWLHLGKLTGDVASDEKEKLSPLDGKKMTYCGEVCPERFFELPVESLGSLDFYKGMPICRDLTHDDIAWLKSVCIINSLAPWQPELLLLDFTGEEPTRSPPGELDV
jgi:hypothetical protein